MKTIKLIKKVIAIFIFLCVMMQNIRIVYAVSDQSQTELQDRSNNKIDKNFIKSLDEENIKEFVDDYFQKNMKKWNVPGAAVAVVKDNKELYKAGYGVSEIERNIPVDADRTTFPAASVSKLFAATAIMQLYQEGKIDLNENIQTYLGDIVIINPYKEKVTCQNLLTHSSGVDEQSELDGSTLDKNAIRSQKQYFEKHIPRVIIKPNTICRYSNMGYNLLGYIIEKVSGRSYEDYINEYILKPLSMQNTSVRIENDSMACGYEFVDGKYQKDSFAYQYTSGSSGIITTVVDMENFMIMHLNNGNYQNKSILDASTEQMMQSKQFCNNDAFDGMGEGFIRTSRNGIQVLKHEGALPGYTSTLILLPKQKFGIYVATNSLNGMIFDFEDAFLQHFCGTSKSITDQESPSSDTNKFIGTYRNYDGVSTSNISKIFAILDEMGQMEVEKTSNGKLKVMYFDQSKEKVETNLIYKTDGVFIREDGNGYITFRENNKGNIEYAFNDISHQAYQKINRFETKTFISLILLVLLLILFGNALIYIIHRIKHKKNDVMKLGLLNGIVNITYVLGFVGVFGLECYMILNYDYRYMGVIYILLTLLLIAIAFNLCGFIRMVYGIIKRKFNKLTMIKFLLVQMAQIFFVILLKYFNMIGYHVF